MKTFKALKLSLLTLFEADEIVVERDICTVLIECTINIMFVHSYIEYSETKFSALNVVVNTHL
jgi:hypothetical protein